MSSPRVDLWDAAPRQYAALVRLDRSIELPPALRVLLKLRASQINGCAFCIDMHWKEARSRGESEERLYMLSAWRECRLYDEREQAALELCEAITQVAVDGVPDATWQRAAEQFSAAEVAQVVFTIAAINAWNRLAIATRKEPGRSWLRVPEVA